MSVLEEVSGSITRFKPTACYVTTVEWRALRREMFAQSWRWNHRVKLTDIKELSLLGVPVRRLSQYSQDANIAPFWMDYRNREQKYQASAPDEFNTLLRVAGTRGPVLSGLPDDVLPPMSGLAILGRN